MADLEETKVEEPKVEEMKPVEDASVKKTTKKAKKTAFRLSCVPLVWNIQSLPPFVDLKIEPRPPATHPVNESMKKTELNELGPEAACKPIPTTSQFEPPSVVFTAVKNSPTAIAESASKQ